MQCRSSSCLGASSTVSLSECDGLATMFSHLVLSDFKSHTFMECYNACRWKTSSRPVLCFKDHLFAIIFMDLSFLRASLRTLQSGYVLFYKCLHGNTKMSKLWQFGLAIVSINVRRLTPFWQHLRCPGRGDFGGAAFPNAILKSLLNHKLNGSNKLWNILYILLLDIYRYNVFQSAQHTSNSLRNWHVFCNAAYKKVGNYLERTLHLANFIIKNVII